MALTITGKTESIDVHKNVYTGRAVNGALETGPETKQCSIALSFAQS